MHGKLVRTDFISLHRKWNDIGSNSIPLHLKHAHGMKANNCITPYLD